MRYALLLACSCLLVLGQTAPSKPDDGLLEGKVLNSVTGEPVRRAQVALMNMSAPSRRKADSPKPSTALTDAEGHFQFSALAPGSYTLMAVRDGFVPETKDAHLSADEKNDVVIRLKPLGVITGRLLDEEGDPVRMAQVSAMVYQYGAGGRQLHPRSNAMSNDLGEYRIFDVQPGRYYLKVTPGQVIDFGEGLSFATSYYPGTPDAVAAAPIEVGAGQTLEGINLTLRRTRTANIRGHVANPGNGLAVGLQTVDENGGTSSSFSSVDDQGGKFELKGVSPGSYLLTLSTTIDGKRHSATAPIQVGAADLEGIEMHLQPPADIAGQIRIEGKSSAKLNRIYLTLETGGRTVHGMSGGGPKEDGSFVLEGLDPGVYHVSLQPPEGLYLKAVRWGDRDVMQSGIDLTQGAADARLTVVLSANGGQVDGLVEDDQSLPAAAMVVLVQAGAAPSRSSVKVARAAANGHFHIQGIAPGSYKLFAWESVDINRVMFDPDFLRPYDSAGQSIEVAEGSKQNVQVTRIKKVDE
jgi:protocatechuate 3,4-dioxygenase beta subunit